SEPAVADNADHFIVNQPVAGAKLVAEQDVTAAAEVGYFSSGLLNNQYTRCDIPGVEVVFKEAFKLSTGDERKVHGGASQSSDAVCFVEEFLYDVEVIVTLVGVILGEASREQAFAQCSDG